MRRLAKLGLEASGELTSVEKIVHGREFYYASWISEGYKELVQKSDTITDDEAISIGLLVAINLFRLREIRLHKSLSSALSAVKDAFALELGVIHSKEMEYRTDREKEKELAKNERKLFFS